MVSRVFRAGPDQPFASREAAFRAHGWRARAWRIGMAQCATGGSGRRNG